MGLAQPDLPANAAHRLSSANLAALEKRQEVLLPLADVYRPSIATIDSAAHELGLSPRTVRHLLRAYRLSNRDPLAFIGKRTGRPPGVKSLPQETERIIREAIEKRFASSQKPSLRALCREVSIRCRKAKTHVPSLRAIRSRLAECHPYFIRRRREGPNAAQQLKPVAGSFPEAEYPLHVVQIDHTEIDAQLVDEERRELGRAYITLAIDIFSRCIAGYYLSFEKPSAVSVGLALANIAEPKHILLKKYGIDAEWPLQGKPTILHTDNAKEFKSEALRRGCVGHGIQLVHRPVAKPWFGGAIERVIGTFMKKVHDDVPGTTFSNPQQRGAYPSQEKAVLTLNEFHGWLLRQIIQYHAEVHTTLREPPLQKLEWGLAHRAHPPAVKNPKSFLIDFLPIERRRITREGVRIFHITYYDPKLDTLIAEREQHAAGFELRYDPRNLRFIWLQVPGATSYMEVPYRNLRNPDISLWEHKRAIRSLREKGFGNVDEDLIMNMVVEQRQIIDEASAKSRRARRDRARLKNGGPLLGSALPSKPKAEEKRSAINPHDIKPFAELEVDW